MRSVQLCYIRVDQKYSIYELFGGHHRKLCIFTKNDGWRSFNSKFERCRKCHFYKYLICEYTIPTLFHLLENKNIETKTKCLKTKYYGTCGIGQRSNFRLNLRQSSFFVKLHKFRWSPPKNHISNIFCPPQCYMNKNCESLIF